MLKHIFLAGLFLISSAGAVNAGTTSGQIDTFWTDRVAFLLQDNRHRLVQAGVQPLLPFRRSLEHRLRPCHRGPGRCGEVLRAHAGCYGPQ
jgi:hypothetical protein